MGHLEKTRRRKRGEDGARVGGSSRAPWSIEFFRDDSRGEVPGRAFLDDCPESVARKLMALLVVIADAPPPAFSGGGYWEAMHGDMAGYYEIRVDGPQRRHYRLFCILEHDGQAVGLKGPSLVVLGGMEKAFQTTFSKRDYERVRALGERFRSLVPRSVAP